MKKKMLSLALALVMCLDLTVPAFASEYGPLEVRFEKKSSSEVVVLVMDKATLSGDKITVIPETTLSMKIENKDTEDWSYRSISLLPDYLHESGEWWVVPNLYEALTDFNSTRNAGELFDTADRYVGYSGAVSSATRYQVGVGDCDKEYYLHIDRSAQGQPTTPAFTVVSAGAYYADAVKWAVENKITSGTGGGNFSPDTICTRGQIMTFLYRAMGK